MTALLIATRNSHKVQEIQAVLADRFSFWSLREFPGAPQVIEDGATFAENASKKSQQLARWLCSHPTMVLERAAQMAGPTAKPALTHLYCLADDSGLEVDALGGAPGVHSARFAALGTAQMGNSPDQANNEKLLSLLKGVPAEERTARFRCVIALTPVLFSGAEAASGVCYANPAEFRSEIFEGVCPGQLLEAPRGAHGFGYDPLFVPVGWDQSFGELSDTAKNGISHRADALRKLHAWLPRLRCY
jgi:XTP/dITP diphosphohydrolase